MARWKIGGLVLACLFSFSLLAVGADSPAPPKSLPADLDKMDSAKLREQIRELCYRIDALEEKVAGKPESSASKGALTASAATLPVASAGVRTWVVTVTSIVPQDTAALEEKVLTLRTQLTGGVAAKADSGGSFSHNDSSSRVVADRQVGRRGRHANENVRAGSDSESIGADVGKGSTVIATDSSYEKRIAQERKKLQDMQQDRVEHTDKRGNPYWNNKYTDSELTRQQEVISKLEHERDSIRRQLEQAKQDLDKASASMVIMGVTDASQAITARVNSKTMASVAKTLHEGQKVQIEGVASKAGADAGLEVSVRTIVPLQASSLTH